MNISKKRMTLLANVFPKLSTSQNVVRLISNSFRLRVPLDKRHAPPAQKHLKFEPWHVYHLYWSLWRELSLKKSLLVICKILGLFFNTSTACDKSSVPNREYLMHPIHMQISQKEKIFSQFFFWFLKSRLNFEHIQKKGDIHS